MWDTPVCPMREKFDSRIFPATIVPQGHNAQSGRGGRATGSQPSKRECPLMSLTFGFLPPQLCRMSKKCSERLKNCLTAPPLSECTCPCFCPPPSGNPVPSKYLVLLCRNPRPSVGDEWGNREAERRPIRLGWIDSFAVNKGKKESEFGN